MIDTDPYRFSKRPGHHDSVKAYLKGIKIGWIFDLTIVVEIFPAIPNDFSVIGKISVVTNTTLP